MMVALETQKLRRDVLLRDDFRCTRCGASATAAGSLYAAQIKPAEKGGLVALSNLRTLCRRCYDGSPWTELASVEETRRAPLAARRYALDLVPTASYWRDDTPDEAFYDFAAVEAEEGRDLQGSRYRFGIILAASMERHVEWVRRLTPGQRPEPPLPYERELSREFLRLFSLAWFRGTIDVRRAVAKATGGDVGEPLAVLSSAGVSRLETRAALSGYSLARSVADSVRAIAVSAFGPDGSRARTPDDLENEVRTYYAGSWIEPGPALDPGGPGLLELAFSSPTAVELRGRRMKVRNREQYERWQKTRVPFSKWIKQTAEEIEADRLAPPQIPRNQATTWLVTERTRYRAAGAIAEAKADARVKQLLYSSKRDDRVCKRCNRRDGIIRPKDDSFWNENTPPLHFRCRCDLVPVVRGRGVSVGSLMPVEYPWPSGQKRPPKVTPKRKLPKADDLQPGFGVYDRSKVQTARALGVRPRGPRRR